MADNYIWHGSLYPSPGSSELTPVSVYFPGIALLIIALSKIGMTNISVEALLLLACFVLFVFLLLQKSVLDRLLRERTTWYYFLPATIIFALTVSPNYLFYAREFKPDTIALLVGYAGLFLAFPANQVGAQPNFVRLVLGGLLCGVPIVFKQQYIAFILGLISYALFYRSRQKLIFVVSVIVFFVASLAALFSLDHLPFWTIKVVSDDGFISLMQAVSDNYPTLIVLAYLCLMGSFISNPFTLSLVGRRLKSFFFLCVHNHFTWAIVPSVAGAFFSSLKVGGNSGNTQLGLFLLVPYFLILFRSISNWKLICIAWISLALTAPAMVASAKSYINACEYRSFAISRIHNTSSAILVGSDVYYAVRAYNGKSRFTDYWTSSLLDEKPLADSFDHLLRSMPEAPRLIFAENLPELKMQLIQEKNYKIIFENATGVIAQLN